MVNSLCSYGGYLFLNSTLAVKSGSARSFSLSFKANMFLILMFRILSLLGTPAAYLRHFTAHVTDFSSSEVLIKIMFDIGSKVLEEINVYHLFNILKV